jgi:putative selenate reductase
MCNECGNCEEFCPYSSAPYKDKFTLFTCEDDFDDSENNGFLPLSDDSARVRLDGKVAVHLDGSELPVGIWALIQAALEKGYLLLD